MNIRSGILFWIIRNLARKKMVILNANIIGDIHVENKGSFIGNCVITKTGKCVITDL